MRAAVAILRRLCMLLLLTPGIGAAQAETATIAVATNFAEAADKRVRLGLLIRQLIADKELTLDEARIRAHVEEMCAGYENAEEMVNIYMSNPQIVQQVEPLALEQMAVDWLVDNGSVKDKKVSFTDYMNA